MQQPDKQRFRIALVGRPNVGKSSLFNRLLGKSHAIVDAEPGVTRDRREAEIEHAGRHIVLIDTAGMEEGEDGTLTNLMMQQTTTAIAQADLACFVIDVQTGLTSEDEHFARWLRKNHKNIVLIANKAEANNAISVASEAYSLGFGDPILTSAAHNLGMGDLLEAIAEHLPEPAAIEEAETDAESAPEEDEDKPINIAIIGRPNAGKSTLLNHILGEERVITSAEAGTTRDAITVHTNYKGIGLKLVDTAGMRRKSKVISMLEKRSVAETIHAIKFAHVVVLVIDATQGVDKQDLSLAELVEKEGRCLVIALNKADMLQNREAIKEQVSTTLEWSLAQWKDVPFFYISAKKGTGIQAMLQKTIQLEKSWNVRVGTGQLNQWLEAMLEKNSPPLVKGKRLKIRYVTQVNTRPPQFVIFSNQSELFPESYLRYLVNGLRESFAFAGVPIRMRAKKSKNPYNSGE